MELGTTGIVVGGGGGVMVSTTVIAPGGLAGTNVTGSEAGDVVGGGVFGAGSSPVGATVAGLALTAAVGADGWMSPATRAPGSAKIAMRVSTNVRNLTGQR